MLSPLRSLDLGERQARDLAPAARLAADLDGRRGRGGASAADLLFFRSQPT